MADGTIEFITDHERRRRWSTAEKLRIVAESEEAGACVTAVAVRHDVYPSLVFHWRRQAREGRLSTAGSAGFVPVRLLASAEQAVSSPPPAAGSAADSTPGIEITLADGSRNRRKPGSGTGIGKEGMERGQEPGNGCRIADRRRKGPASGLALRAPLPRRSGMRRAGGVFPKHREDEPHPEEPIMAELRSVDPRTLHVNPNNPRRTPVPLAMDEQLVASIRAVGIIQPPCVTATDGGLEIAVGNRRVKAAITAGLEAIDVLVCTADEAADAMRAVAENLIRASMSSVDIWRAIERLEAQGWNEQAIGDALALPVRTVRRLKLLAQLHPPMLDVMALGSMPNEEQLRTIAAASREEQAQVWKKHKPKKGQAEVAWYEVARALAKRRMPASAAKFGDDLAKAYGIVWEDDLFAPPGDDSRYTTNVEGFFGAQQEWLQNNLPERGTLLPVNDYGQGQLPKKAERVYSKPGKTDLVGHYIDVRTGAVETVAYRLPEPKKAGKPAGSGKAATSAAGGGGTDDDAMPTAGTRPEVTQKGVAMIGDLRTDALHQALADTPIEDETLLGLLVLAFGGDNVSVDSGSDLRGDDRQAICRTITEGGVLTADLDLLRQAARRMLIGVLSCRENRSQSGAFARIAGEAIGASLRLPNMATEEFLSCVSRGALETAARTEGVRVEPRAKDTRARMITRFKDGPFVYPGALFRLTPEELAAAAKRRHGRSGAGWVGPATGDDGEGGGDDGTEPETGDENDAGFEREAA